MMDGIRSKAAASPLARILLALALALSAAPSAVQANDCMEDLFGGSTLCNAGDFTFGGVSGFKVYDGLAQEPCNCNCSDTCPDCTNVADPISCSQDPLGPAMPQGTVFGACLGDDDTISLALLVDLSVQNTAYDVGLYVAVDGGNALTGKCEVATLKSGTYTASDGSNIVVGEFETGTNADNCFDISGSGDIVGYEMDTIDFPCNSDGDNLLTFFIAAAYGGTDSCDVTSGDITKYPVPDQKPKCWKSTVPFKLDIYVPGNPAPSPTPSEMPSGQPSDTPSRSSVPTISAAPVAVTKDPSSQPSESPSASGRPSSQPSSQPSAAPSENPSVSSRPSSQPSSQPSGQPSETPSTSSAPSSQPSSQPSGQPSESPSVSDWPTSQPSSRPSSQPSEVPSTSSEPSSIPSSQPSSQPSSFPSVRPSESPSMSSDPSAQPSSSPSSQPSEAPSSSAMPSENPSSSSAPSGQPSMKPSVSNWPTSQPSETPSISTQPSSIPSSQPSSQPSQKPSVSDWPTSQPSSLPSAQPSEEPSTSNIPSSIPSSQPSTQPSENPSASAVPSSQPSMIPTLAATEVPSVSTEPSSQPSRQPSSNPSEKPSVSGSPSSIPSESPSTSAAPSSQPSENPSVSNRPTSQPSSQPSTEPSMNPSVSAKPSSMPSESPSSLPSMSPSISTMPSVLPTMNPSISAAPSEPPSESPSLEPSVSLRPSLPYYEFFYPDWSDTSSGCLNDGQEPLYMRKTPSSYLFTSAEECCQVHFNFDIQNCRKESLGPPKFYPDFDGTTGGCKSDGKAPKYMKRYDDYLFDTLEECCLNYFPWNVDGCLNPELAGDPCAKENIFSFYDAGYNADYLTEDEVGYYPVWDADESENVYCVNDGNAPPYMNTHPDANWKHHTLADCCWQNFQWAFRECMGDIYGEDGELLPLAPCAEPPPESSGMWYVEYYSDEDFHCVQDCQGEYPCNGRPSSFKELYDTFTVCCNEHTWWNVDCAAYDENGTGTEEPYSNKYFAEYQGGRCLRDCEPGDDAFGCAQVPPPVALYDSIEDCCANGQSWVDSGYCHSRSVGNYTNGWIVQFSREACAKDCDPADGPPCVDHKGLSATIYDSAAECCERLDWVDQDACVVRSERGTNSQNIDDMEAGYSNKYFADYQSGSCLRDCEPGDNAFGCAQVPPPIALYDSIDDCCSEAQSWVDPGYCKSRSVGGYTNGWIVQYGSDEKCVKDCDPASGPPCTDHNGISATIYKSVADCCDELDWLDPGSCVSYSESGTSSVSRNLRGGMHSNRVA